MTVHRFLSASKSLARRNVLFNVRWQPLLRWFFRRSSTSDSSSTRSSSSSTCAPRPTSVSSFSRRTCSATTSTAGRCMVVPTPDSEKCTRTSSAKRSELFLSFLHFVGGMGGTPTQNFGESDDPILREGVGNLKLWPLITPPKWDRGPQILSVAGIPISTSVPNFRLLRQGVAEGEFFENSPTCNFALEDQNGGRHTENS